MIRAAMTVGPDVLTTSRALRASVDDARRQGKRVGFVPTMGALHRGHLALVAEARRRSDFVVVSIFVNPTQFGPNEDLSRYPRPFEADRSLAAEAGVDVLFAPAPSEMYPPGDQTRVRVERLATHLCGPHRPGHFEGVATVVAKLFALVGPAAAFFGRKDYQQLRVIEQMTRDLLLPMEVVPCPTVRESDGLAMSSRNVYLSAEERARAATIPRVLANAVRAFESGERRISVLREQAHALLAPAVTSIDYLTLADPATLETLDPSSSAADRALIALAVRVGTTRLIDNVVLGEDAAPVP